MSMKKKSATTMPTATIAKKTNFREDNHQEQRNGRANHHEKWWEDAGDLSRIIAELERRCTHMEMERKEQLRSSGQSLVGYGLILN